MYRIRFQTASRIWTFDEHRVVRVGSAPDSDIVLDEPGICPLHAELRPTDAGGNCTAARAAPAHG